MTDDKAILRTTREARAQEGPNSFATLLRQEGDNIRRDVFLMLGPEESVSGRIQSGSTTLYPHCAGRGHEHGDREEVYFFTRGRGVMGVDGVEYEVEAGDVFYIKPGPFHTTRNDSDFPLEFFWITIKV